MGRLLMRRLLTLYVETDDLPDEPTWADLLAAVTNGHIQTAVILDAQVPNLQDILDARKILDGTATVDTRPTAARPGHIAGMVGEALQDIAIDAAGRPA